jgi:hypothetical protein
MPDTFDVPIEVHASPVPDQLWAGLRTAVVAVSTFAIGRGWIQSDTAVMLTAVAGVLFPIIMGQLKTRKRAKQLAVTSAASPDNVAVVKP